MGGRAPKRTAKTAAVDTPMAAAFLAALRERVEQPTRRPIVLPTGVANADEVKRVLEAIERARRKG
jgi:hypothetical protein